MENNLISHAVKTELKYHLMRLLIFALIVTACSISYSVIKSYDYLVFKLLNGALFWSAFFIFILCYSQWKSESRISTYMKFPFSADDIWQIKSITNSMIILILLFSLLLFELAFNSYKSFLTIILNFLIQTGIVFTAYFVHEMFNDFLFGNLKNKANLKLSNKIFIISSGTFVSIFIFGTITATYFYSSSINNYKSSFSELIRISGLFLIFLPLILIPISRKIFKNRREFI